MQRLDIRSWIEISKKNLFHNIRITKRQLEKKTKCFAVVKSNAYGHDMTLVAHAIEHHVDGFCVANTEEALLLRRSGIRKRIIVVSYFTTLNPLHLNKLQKARIEVPIHSKEQLLSIIKTNIALLCHLKIDTGTARIGIDPKETKRTLALIAQSRLQLRGVYSHFADVEDTQSDFSKYQLKLFLSIADEVRHVFPDVERHMACSAATLRLPLAQCDAIRLGIHLYGLSGFNNQTIVKKFQLRPVLTWKTRVLQLKRIKPNTTVGYNRSWTARKKTTIITLPVGYWDGYSRKLSNKGMIAIHESCLAHIRGTVCMNLIMAEKTCRHASHEGDVVELIGKRVSADHIARLSDAINYEVITRIHPDIPRILV